MILHPSCIVTRLDTQKLLLQLPTTQMKQKYKDDSLTQMFALFTFFWFLSVWCCVLFDDIGVRGRGLLVLDMHHTESFLLSPPFLFLFLLFVIETIALHKRKKIPQSSPRAQIPYILIQFQIQIVMTTDYVELRQKKPQASLFLYF